MREGMMDDCGYRGFEECCRHEDCCKDAYQQGRLDAIDEFVEVMRKYYWDSELQSSKDDPCVIDSMIDLVIRTAKQLKEQDK